MRKIRTGWLAVSGSFDTSKHLMDAPLLLVDPDAEFDYGAGKLSPLGLRRLLVMHRGGSPLHFSEASGFVSMFRREGTPLGALAMLVLLAPVAFLSSFFTEPLAGSIFVVTTMLAILVACEFWATWENRRTEALHRVLTALQVEFPAIDQRNGAVTDSKDIPTKDIPLARKVHDAVARLRMELNQVWMNNYTGGEGAGILHRVVARADRKVFNAETDQLLYSAARALDEHSPELVDAVAARMLALAERISEARRRPEPNLPAVEAPKPQRSIAELARELSVPVEPESVEYDAHPVIAAYPHAKEVGRG